MPDNRNHTADSALDKANWYASPERWRARLLTLLLSAAAVLGSVVAVPSIYISLALDTYLIAVLDTAAVLVVLGLLFSKRISYRMRAAAFCLIAYVLGTGLLVAVGPVSQTYLLAFSLVAVLLLGTRAGAVTIALNAVTLLVLGVAGFASEAMIIEDWGDDVVAWLVVTLNFVLINSLLVLSLGTVIAALEKALSREAVARAALERERSDLLRANEALRIEVTERARAEAALSESEARFRELADNVHDVFYNFDPVNNQVLYVSPAYENIWGRPLSDLYADYEDYIAGIHPDDRGMVLEATARQLEGESTTVEGRVLRPDGEIRWVLDYAYPVCDETGAVRRLVGTVQDITERKRAEHEREALEARLRESQKLEAVGRLAGGIAHDFNNMLTVILGNAGMALEGLGEQDPLRDNLEPILKAGERSAELTSQLLAYARRQTIEPRVLDIDAAVGGAVKLLERLAGSDIALAWNPGPGLKQVKMDPAQIDQMLTNLTLNARDAIAGIGRIVIASNLVEIGEGNPERTAGSYVTLSVTDDGSGMDEATAAQAFEPFFTTRPQGQGTGLGLAMVYGIVTQNKGFVELHTRPGKGTTFTLYLPQHAGESAAAAPENPARLRGTETILLVEDEPTLLDLATRTLERQGYRVLASDKPAEALRICEACESPIHLLVTDAIMPEMNGRELLEQVRKSRPDIRSLYISGYPQDVLALHGATDSRTMLLLKPFTVRELAERVRETLDAPPAP